MEVKALINHAFHELYWRTIAHNDVRLWPYRLIHSSPDAADESGALTVTEQAVTWACSTPIRFSEYVMMPKAALQSPMASNSTYVGTECV